jgi:hypothetical protein
MAEEVAYPTLSRRRRCPAIVRTGTKRIVYRREDLDAEQDHYLERSDRNLIVSALPGDQINDQVEGSDIVPASGSQRLEPCCLRTEERGQRRTCYGPSTSHDTMSCNARTASAIGVPTIRIATANATTTIDASANSRTRRMNPTSGVAPAACLL